MFNNTMPVTTPTQETQRLEALRQYQILDTPPESAYDEITTLASFICDVPIALISLVDTERQWFKSKVGIDVAQTPRDVSFCSHTIEGEGIMIVQDALYDRRFMSNPLVTSSPHIRFYAGVPLLTPSGQPLGTLCVIDRQPKDLSDSQQNALKALANQVMTQLELRRVSSQLAVSLAQIRVMEGLIPICSYCKGIRDDHGYWLTVEKFIQQHSDVGFTHGICNDCMKVHFPDVAEVLLENGDLSDQVL